MTGNNNVLYGTGASHGGEAGAENSNHLAPSAYGSFISPDEFGSAGGDVASYKGTTKLVLLESWLNLVCCTCFYVCFFLLVTYGYIYFIFLMLVV